MTEYTEARSKLTPHQRSEARVERILLLLLVIVVVHISLQVLARYSSPTWVEFNTMAHALLDEDRQRQERSADLVAPE